MLIWSTAALAVLLAVQLEIVRPALNRRANCVLAGEDLPRSRALLAYIGLEVVKLALLGVSGWVALLP